MIEVFQLEKIKAENNTNFLLITLCLVYIVELITLVYLSLSKLIKSINNDKF